MVLFVKVKSSYSGSDDKGVKTVVMKRIIVELHHHIFFIPFPCFSTQCILPFIR